MIQANELRIGNLVLYEGELFEIDFDSFNIIKELEPIELTEEILLKCNFKKCEDKNCPGKCYIIDIGDEKDLSYCFKSYNVEYNCIYLNTKKIKIDYLHQLQNFIFAYTGTELDVSKVTK